MFAGIIKKRKSSCSRAAMVSKGGGGGGKISRKKTSYGGRKKTLRGGLSVIGLLWREFGLVNRCRARKEGRVGT